MIPDDAQALGAWLAELRDAAGLTQYELAQAAGVAQRTVQRWEKGEHAPVDAIRVLTALGVRLDPPEPEQVRALNAGIRDLQALLEQTDELSRNLREAPPSPDDRLAALEELVGELPTAADLRDGLESIRQTIAAASSGTRAARPASR